MGNGNGTDDIELNDAGKNSVVSVDRYSDEPKTPPQNVAKAYPSTSQQSEGQSLKVSLSLNQPTMSRC
jgi:hypothetical protein